MNQGIDCGGISARGVPGRDGVRACKHVHAFTCQHWYIRWVILVSRPGRGWIGETTFGPMWWMSARKCVWRGRQTGECHWKEGGDGGSQATLAPNKALCRVRAVMGITLSTKVAHREPPYRLSIAPSSALAPVDVPTNRQKPTWKRESCLTACPWVLGTFVRRNPTPKSPFFPCPGTW